VCDAGGCGWVLKVIAFLHKGDGRPSGKNTEEEFRAEVSNIQTGMKYGVAVELRSFWVCDNVLVTLRYHEQSQEKVYRKVGFIVTKRYDTSLEDFYTKTRSMLPKTLADDLKAKYIRMYTETGIYDVDSLFAVNIFVNVRDGKIVKAVIGDWGTGPKDPLKKREDILEEIKDMFEVITEENPSAN
jgi:hypothetical protein